MTTSVWGVDHGEDVSKATKVKDRHPALRPEAFNSRKQNVQVGAGAGAVGGAIGTRLIGHRVLSKPGAILAGVGALGGAAIGSTGDHAKATGAKKRQRAIQQQVNDKASYKQARRKNNADYYMSFGKNHEGDTMSTISVWGVNHGAELVSKAGTGLAIGAGTKLGSSAMKARVKGRQLASPITATASRLGERGKTVGRQVKQSARVANQTKVQPVLRPIVGSAGNIGGVAADKIAVAGRRGASALNRGGMQARAFGQRNGRTIGAAAGVGGAGAAGGYFGSRKQH